MKIVSQRPPLKVYDRLAHRVGRSSQATPAAVGKSQRLQHEKQTRRRIFAYSLPSFPLPARKIFPLSFSPIENPYYNGGLGAGAWWFRMGIMWALLLGVGG
jgi:hypothetical protein